MKVMIPVGYVSMRIAKKEVLHMLEECGLDMPAYWTPVLVRGTGVHRGQLADVLEMHMIALDRSVYAVAIEKHHRDETNSPHVTPTPNDPPRRCLDCGARLPPRPTKACQPCSGAGHSPDGSPCPGCEGKGHTGHMAGPPRIRCDACKKAATRERNARYYHARYHSDPDFRESQLARKRKRPAAQP